MRGYGVPLIGVDRSAQMLRIAAERLRGQGVLLIRQDMRRLRLPRPVDLITCNGDTLNYLLAADELASTPLHCRKNLRPGGHLIADLLCGHPTDGNRILSAIRDGSAGHVSLWRTRSDRARRLTRVEIDFGHPDTNGETRWTMEMHVQRWHRPSDLDAAAQQAGLRLVLAEPLVVERDRPKPAAWPGSRSCSVAHRRGADLLGIRSDPCVPDSQAPGRTRRTPELIRRRTALPAEPSPGLCYLRLGRPARE
jgi:SAM-dependent methyltransferase